MVCAWEMVCQVCKVPAKCPQYVFWVSGQERRRMCFWTVNMALGPRQLSGIWWESHSLSSWENRCLMCEREKQLEVLALVNKAMRWGGLKMLKTNCLGNEVQISVMCTIHQSEVVGWACLRKSGWTFTDKQGLLSWAPPPTWPRPVGASAFFPNSWFGQFSLT